MSVLGRVTAMINGAFEAWDAYGIDQSDYALINAAYADLWGLYVGTAFSDAWRRRGVFTDTRMYANSRLMWKHVEAVGDFWSAMIYQGALATDGKRLPDGSRGAIPWDAQTGDDATDDALYAALAELAKRWNWQLGMTLRPMYVSVLGDGLTELIDDPGRHAVWPQFIWPGYVTHIDLDSSRNVKAYTLEYPIEERRDDGSMQSFRFRKEVDKETFRYFRDDRPWDAYGEGAIVDNPYGFVPAVWDVFKVGGGARGISAISGTRQALAEVNSLLSHGFDYQRKVFSQPVLIKGAGITTSILDSIRQVIGPSRTIDPVELAEAMPYREVGPTGGFEQITADLGSTIEVFDRIRDGILDENPEARFWKELREMSTLTGPGAERALGDVTSRVTRVRAGMDINTIKLFQMAISMCAYRYHAGAWENPTPRDRVFEPFTDASYTDGALDLTILERPVVPRTEEERVALLVQEESLQERESFIALGYSEADADTRLTRREGAQMRRANIFGGYTR